MKQKRLSATQQVFVGQVLSLWPALKGSLAQVHKPCIRPACPACACGDKHAAWLLSFTHRGKRQCMYVPIGLVSSIQRAVKNGRRIEELLYQIGPRLIREYRQEQSGAKKRPTGASPTKSGHSKKKNKTKS